MAGHLTDRRRYLEAGRQRIADARVLLGAGRWNGAVYLAGFAMECLLKVRILRRSGLRRLPREHRHHELQRLAASAGTPLQVRRDLGLLCAEWAVTIRYEERRFTGPEARAVLRRVGRVLKCLFDEA